MFFQDLWSSEFYSLPELLKLFCDIHIWVTDRQSLTNHDGPLNEIKLSNSCFLLWGRPFASVIIPLWRVPLLRTCEGWTVPRHWLAGSALRAALFLLFHSCSWRKSLHECSVSVILELPGSLLCLHWFSVNMGQIRGLEVVLGVCSLSS